MLLRIIILKKGIYYIQKLNIILEIILNIQILH